MKAHGAQACRLGPPKTGARRGASRVGRFLRAIFFEQASRVNIPTNLLPSERRLREEMEDDGEKMTKGVREGELLRFRRFGFASFGSPQANNYSSL